MARPANSQANRLLGYPADARLLITNADDFGMCHAVNGAIREALSAGLVRSTTLMMPCPWAPEALQFLAAHSEQPFGIHLTVISDPDGYRWGPLAGRDRVPSLVDRAGYFFRFHDFHERLPQVRIEELELEFRAQIEAVFGLPAPVGVGAGLRPTHLDWHAIRFGGRRDIPELMTRLAREYGLAQRVIGRDWIESVQKQGLPCIERDFLDSYGLDPAAKAAHYARLLHELPAGLSEWAIHPGRDSAELLAIEPEGQHVRQSELDFWTSPLAKERVEAEGIILLDYRGVQEVWKEMRRT